MNIAFALLLYGEVLGAFPYSSVRSFYETAVCSSLYDVEYLQDSLVIKTPESLEFRLYYKDNNGLQ